MKSVMCWTKPASHHNTSKRLCPPHCLSAHEYFSQLLSKAAALSKSAIPLVEKRENDMATALTNENQARHYTEYLFDNAGERPEMRFRDLSELHDDHTVRHLDQRGGRGRVVLSGGRRQRIDHLLALCAGGFHRTRAGCGYRSALSSSAVFSEPGSVAPRPSPGAATDR